MEEGDNIMLQKDPQIFYSTTIYDSPSYDLYDFDGKLRNEEPK